MAHIRRFIMFFLRKLVESQATDEDVARRELILNILLLVSIFLSGLAALASFIDYLTLADNNGTPWVTFGIFCVFTGLLLLSKKGGSRLASYIFLAIYFIPTTHSLGTWGIYLPQPLLIYALLLIMASILLGTRFAFILSSITTVVLLGLAFLQSHQIIVANFSWTQNISPTLTDACTFSLTLFVITIVSWLSNREIEKSLRRARISEVALMKERDLLEQRVEERTQQLKAAQVEKMTQLYRFAELGKASSGLFHELVNPLTTISLNLNQLHHELDQESLARTKTLLARALVGTKHMESFIQAARKQMQNQEVLESFSLKNEVNQALQMLAYKARLQKVTIELHVLGSNPHFFGNPLKFVQIITNLVSNAIDAYEGSQKPIKKVAITVKKQEKNLEILIQDWGMGISPSALSQIFNPLFTTKSIRNGSGIGLAITKDLIEKDFHGTIEVESQPRKGSTFTLKLEEKNIYG